MTIVVAALLACAALYYVCLPLLRRETEETASGDRLDAEEKKVRALEAILDLESDLELGRITADELEVLRAEHERDAIDAMRELDVLEMAASDSTVEKAIAAERDRITCPACGTRKVEEERCPSCGA
ncbi:MAG TPA: zinc ribbon domain-containing protein [Actinomycetota bacterium]|nr:zinc ribbon domain-containing protein [Actinomycetota bacterium]